MTSKYLIAPVAMAVALFAGAASAQSSGAAATGSAGATGSGAAASGAAPMAKPQAGAQAKKEDKLARGDRKFIEDAAQHGMFEIRAGELAATKATDPAVKTYASELVKERTAAHQQLQQIASQHQVDMPKELPRSLRNKLQDLEKQTGAEFDRTFVREVGVDVHQDNVKMFEKAGKDLKDPQLKAWADKTLPTIKEHLAEAKQLPQASGDAKRMGAPGNGGAPAAGAGKSGG